MTCGIYTITSKVDNKIYVGYSSNIETRWNCHKSELRNNKHKNNHLQSSWNKYGAENFLFEVLWECEEWELTCQEHYWATLLNVHNPEYGYNILLTDPNLPFGKSSIETRLKNSLKQKGRKFTEEHKLRIKEKRSLQKITEVAKSRQRETNKGKKDSEEVKRRKSEAAKIRKVNLFCGLPNPVVQISMDYEYIERYNGVKEASRRTGIGQSAISASASGKQEGTGGFRWVYEYDYIEWKTSELINFA